MAVAEGDQAGGYDIDFVCKPDDSLFCPICLMVARDAKQHGKCGQLFCSSCLDKHKKQQHNCPYCKEDNAILFEDNRSNRQIRSLLVRCVYKQDGCQWEGELRSSADHATHKCDYRVVKCPLECGLKFKWLVIDLHQKEGCKNRPFQCQHCQETGQYWHITTDHMKICPMVLIKCPNSGCDMKICRKLQTNHVDNDCEYTPVECKYKSGGCKQTLIRKDVEVHENNDKFHLQILCGTVATQQVKLETFQETIAILQGQIEALQIKIDDLLPFSTTWKIQDFNITSSLYKEIQFDATPGTYEMTAYIAFVPHVLNHVIISFAMRKGRNDEKLQWPFSGSIKVELLNQQEDKDHYSNMIHIDKLDRVDRPEDLSYSTCTYNIVSINDLIKLKQNYYSNQTLYVRVTVRAGSHKPWLQ